MGRRALRKIDPELDLARHCRLLEELPKPWDPVALYGRAAPLEVEIGTGKGLFLQGAAARTPEHDFLGCEIAAKYARFAAARLVRAGLDNGCVIAGDGLRLVREWLPDGAAVAVHVYFPDPWWKKRHRKRRVLNEPFLADVARVLAPGGSLHFWTDVEEYFEETLSLLKALPALAGPLPVPEQTAEHDLDYRTHFERRTRKSELPVFRAEYRRS